MYPHPRPDSGLGIENVPTPIEREFRQTQTMENSPLRKSGGRPFNPQPQLSSSAAVGLRVYYEVDILGLVYESDNSEVSTSLDRISLEDCFKSKSK